MWFLSGVQRWRQKNPEDAPLLTAEIAPKMLKSSKKRK